VIPDCSKGVYRPFRITSREKREIVRALAEKGMKGLDEYIEEGRGEGAISDRMEEIRRRISEQVERVKAARRADLEEGISRMGMGMAKGGRDDLDPLLDDPSVLRRYSSERIRGTILADDLVLLLESREERPSAVTSPGLLRRIWLWLRRAARRIWKTILRVIGKVIGLFRGWGRQGKVTKGRDKGALSLPFPGLDIDLGRWESELGRRLQDDPHLQDAVNERLSERYGYSSGEIMLRSSADPEWYKEEAAKVLREEVSSKAEEERARIDERMKSARADRSREEMREKALRDSMMEMERAFESEAREMDRSVQQMSRKELRRELLSTLTFMGLLQRGDGDGMEYEITEALVEKFSELLYAELHGNLFGKRERRGHQTSDSGVYDKDRLRTVHEESRMDMLSSVVNSRINHPKDRGLEPGDMMVLREVSTSEVHASILVDISGSMEENSRLEAAKRAVLALTQAIRRDNPRNRTDIISVSTRARPVTLKEVMSMEARGFTNFQEGFHLARTFLEASRSDRKLLFVITDGLPEAYIGPDGKPVAGDLAMAMDLSLTELRKFRRMSDLTFITFLLEPRDQTFVGAAKRLAKEGGGGVIVADPLKLGAELLKGYYSSGPVMSGI